MAQLLNEANNARQRGFSASKAAIVQLPKLRVMHSTDGLLMNLSNDSRNIIDLMPSDKLAVLSRRITNEFSLSKLTWSEQWRLLPGQNVSIRIPLITNCSEALFVRSDRYGTIRTDGQVTAAGAPQEK